MKLIIYGVWVLLYGYYCDFLIFLLTKITDNRLKNKRPLNKRFMSLISNLSNNSLKKWQRVEQKFIAMELSQRFF